VRRRLEVSEDEKNYSDFFQIGANTVNILALLSGFTFTGITILLSMSPVLESVRLQFILFFLASLFFLFMYLLLWANGLFMRLCKNLPPLTSEVASFNRLIIVGYMLLQSAVIVMFLIWNFIYVSLASGAVLAMFILLQLRRLKVLGRFRKGEP